MEYSVVDFKDCNFESLSNLLNVAYGANVSLDELHRHFLGEQKGIVVATIQNNDVIGCAFFEAIIDHMRKTKTLYITYVATDPLFRKKGVATNIFSGLEAIAKQLHCSSIEMTSANYRVEAHRLYEHLGFTRKATTHFIKEMEF